MDLFAAVHHHVANAGAAALERPTLCLDSILLYEAAAGVAPARSAFAAQPAKEEAAVAVTAADAQMRPPMPPAQSSASEIPYSAAPALLAAVTAHPTPPALVLAPERAQSLLNSLFGFDEICFAG